MIDSETKKRLDELEDWLTYKRFCTPSDTATIAIAVVLFAIVVGGICLLAFWDTLCEQVAITALKQAIGPLPPPG